MGNWERGSAAAEQISDRIGSDGARPARTSRAGLPGSGRWNSTACVEVSIVRNATDQSFKLTAGVCGSFFRSATDSGKYLSGSCSLESKRATALLEDQTTERF